MITKLINIINYKNIKMITKLEYEFTPNGLHLEVL